MHDSLFLSLMHTQGTYFHECIIYIYIRLYGKNGTKTCTGIQYNEYDTESITHTHIYSMDQCSSFHITVYLGGAWERSGDGGLPLRRDSEAFAPTNVGEHLTQR